MKQRLLRFLFLILAVSFVWGQKPTKGFPYEYYSGSERSYAHIFREYSLSNAPSTTVEDNKRYTLRLYRSGHTHVLVFHYKGASSPSESELKRTLKDYQDVIKTYDGRIDADNYRNMDICLVFLNADDELICMATYSEE